MNKLLEKQQMPLHSLFQASTWVSKSSSGDVQTALFLISNLVAAPMGTCQGEKILVKLVLYFHQSKILFLQRGSQYISIWRQHTLHHSWMQCIFLCASKHNSCYRNFEKLEGENFWLCGERVALHWLCFCPWRLLPVLFLLPKLFATSLLLLLYFFILPLSVTRKTKLFVCSKEGQPMQFFPSGTLNP